MKDAGLGLLFAKFEEESNEALAQSSDHFGNANQRIGELLRHVY